MVVLTPHKHAGRTSQPRRSHSGERRSFKLPLRPFPGRGWRLTSRWKRRLLLIGGLVALTGIVAVVAFVAWVSQDLPDPNKLNDRSVAQSTKIYARDGDTLLYEVHGEQRRTLVDLADIGKYTKQAILTIEDRNFYKHKGISFRGILRALFVDITSGKRAQGGSTITQQLVKNAILTNEKSVVRKVKEVVLAYQIERRFTKDQILKLYFNEIPWGSNAYGVEAAAQTYFGKSAKNLDLPESALLAAMVQRPTYYSPRGTHQKELIARQQFILSKMADDKYITKSAAEAARAVDVLARVPATRDRIVAPHFVFYVRDILEEKFGTAEIERGGYKVVTTLDPELQRIAEEEVAAGAERNEKYGASNAAFVAIEPRSGQLLAMVGSRDYFDVEHDGNFNATTALRNPGSSFKPIVYLTAFMKGYTPDTVIFDLKTDFGPDGSGKTFSPSNYDFKEHGPLKMRQTLAGSLNIPAVKTLYLAGINDTVDTAQKLGYTSLDASNLGLALAIGGGAVRLTEHVSAFATLANDGVRHPTTPILRVEDSRGKVLDLYNNQETRVVPEQAVRQLTSVMSDNTARSFIFGSRSPLVLSGRPVAAKTGTTNDFKDGYTVGFTEQLAAGVWVGNNDNTEMRRGSDGVIVAAPIWNAFMRRALEGDPVKQFTRPRGTNVDKPVLNGKVLEEKRVYVDTETKRRIPESCLSSWPSAFVSEAAVREVHEILHYVMPSDPAGPNPTNPDADPMYERWEKPVQEWAKKNNYVSKEPALEDCSLRVNTSTASIAIVSPTTNSTVNDDSLMVVVDPSGFPAATQATFHVDDEVITTSTAAPFTTTLDLSDVSSGFHTIRVVAEDAAGITASAQISINLIRSKVATVYFISPSGKATYAASSFPRTVRVFAYDPAGVALVTLSLKHADGTTEVLDTAVSPEEETITLSWPTTQPGSYDLYFTMRNKKSVSKQSDVLPVTVN